MITHRTSYLPALRGVSLKKGVSFALCLAMLSVAACDISGKKEKDLKAPSFNKRGDHTNITIDKVREIAGKAPNDRSTSIRANGGNLSGSDLAGPSAMGYSNSQPDNLFAMGTASPEARFKRLENAVQNLSNEFKELKPSILRLIAIERDLGSITHQLETLLKQEAPPARASAMLSQVEMDGSTTMNAAPVAQPLNLQQANQAIAASMNKTVSRPYTPRSSGIKPGNLIHTMRIADHSGKTRIVFETTERLDYDVSVDNDENLVTLTFPRGNLGSDPNRLSRHSKLIKAISQVDEGNGSLLVFELAKGTSVMKQERIGPNKDNSHHRFFIDLKW